MKNTIDQQEQADNAAIHPLWIYRGAYIPVDEAGYCVGKFAEGSLGFVIQLQQDGAAGQFHALKLPRLLGETFRENAYINDLMEQEMNAVLQIINQGGASKGLLNANRMPEGPLRGKLDQGGVRGEAEQWEQAVVLVCYEKGAKPRFCLVKKAGNAIKRLPELADCPVQTVPLYDQLEKATDFWKKTIFIQCTKHDQAAENPTGEQTYQFFLMQEAINTDPVGKLWAVCLPSVMYQWAAGTLQEVISRGLREKKWAIIDHLALIKKVSQALDALHSEKMLHADLRPANVVYAKAPAKPEDYSVSDYGSFSKTGARPADHGRAEETLRGPTVGGERTSVFYAAERRAGQERETADMAILVTVSERLFVILGWQKDLLDDKAEQLRITREQWLSYLQHLGENEAKPSNTALQQRDRIQLRDYIFELVDNERMVAIPIGENDPTVPVQILECKRTVWQVYQGRILTIVDDFPQEFERFSLSRVVELREWSAATDLYSLGVLALYSIYREQTESAGNSENNAQVEDDFRQMISYLTNQSHFNTIWPELEQLRQQLEDNIGRSDLHAQSFAELPFITPKGTAAEKQKRNAVQKPYTLLDELVAVTNLITQTTPGAQRLVAAVEANLGAFIFFIHFVLCCLHRQADMSPEASLMGMDQLFCRDRHEQPTENGAADKAVKRLTTIMQHLASDKLSKVTSQDQKILAYNPRSDTAIRVAYEKLQVEYDSLDRERQVLHRTLEQALQSAQEASFFNARSAITRIRDVLITPYLDNTEAAV